MILHILGNGPSVESFPLDSKGNRIGCNFTDEKFNCDWTMIADIKPIKRLYEGYNLPCPAVLTDRAHAFTEKKAVKMDPRRMKLHRVKPFLRRKNIHDRWGMNSAQHATWYGIEEFKPKEVHIWGCDAIWSTNIESSTDLIVHKDVEFMNKTEIHFCWRDYWNYIIEHYAPIKFYVHAPEKPDLKEVSNLKWVVT